MAGKVSTPQTQILKNLMRQGAEAGVPPTGPATRHTITAAQLIAEDELGRSLSVAETKKLQKLFDETGDAKESARRLLNTPPSAAGHKDDIPTNTQPNFELRPGPNTSLVPYGQGSRKQYGTGLREVVDEGHVNFEMRPGPSNSLVPASENALTVIPSRALVPVSEAGLPAVITAGGKQVKTPISKRKLLGTALIAGGTASTFLTDDKSDTPTGPAGGSGDVSAPTAEDLDPEAQKAKLEADRKEAFTGAVVPPTYESISAFTEKPPEHLQQKVQYQNPETGETEELTAAELVTEAQTQLAETLVELQKEYRTERDAERSRELWYAIAVGVGQMALGWYGAKRGVDTTGLKFPAIDWAARQRLLLDGYTEDRTTAKDRHAATMQLAQEARYRTEESRKQAWDEYQAKYSKWKTVQDAVVQRNTIKQREFQDQVELVKLADAREANKARTDAALIKASGKLNTDDIKHARRLRDQFDDHLAAAAKADSEDTRQTHISIAGALNRQYEELVEQPLVEHKLFETIPGYVWDTKPDLEKIQEAYRKGPVGRQPPSGSVTVSDGTSTGVIPASNLEKFLKDYPSYKVVE